MTAKKKLPDFYCSNALVDVLDVVDVIFDAASIIVVIVIDLIDVDRVVFIDPDVAVFGYCDSCNCSY